MACYLVEVQGKFYLETDQDVEKLPENIYARISECFKSDDEIIDIEISTYAIPGSGAPD
jgi:hypothetical protein